MSARPRTTERGAALIMALLLTALMLLLGTTFLSVAVIDRQISGNDLAGEKAFNLAEAGLERAVAELPNRDLDALLTGGGTLFASQSLGGGTYTVTVANNTSITGFPTATIPTDTGGTIDDTDGYLVVTSTGTFGAGSRSIRAIGRKSTGSTWGYSWTAYGINSFIGSSGGDFVGHVGTNGAMTFSGSAPKVTGDGDAVVSITSAPLYVTGTATVPSSPQSFPDVACPAVPWGPAPTGSGVVFNGVTGALTITGASATTFSTGTYYFSSITKSGTGDLTLSSPTDSADIHVSGALVMSGGAFVNPSSDSENMQIWGCGSTVDSWPITGDVPSWITVYAPHKDLSFSGLGNKNGSFIGRSITNTGSGDLVWDVSLGAYTFPLTAGTWTEIW